MANAPVQPTQVGYQAAGIYNGPIPPEGPKCIPIQLDFSAQNSYLLDFTLIQQRGFISELQAVFIDNSLNASPVMLTVNGTNQVVQVGGGTQGIYPIFVPNPPKFTAFSNGGVNVGMQFLNVPITCVNWNSNTSSFSFSGSALETADTILDATVANGHVTTQEFVQGSTDALIPKFVGTDLYTGSTSTSTAQTVIAGAPNMFLTFAEVLFTPDSYNAGGEITVSLIDTSGPTTIAEGIIYLPSGAPTITQATPPCLAILLENFQYITHGVAGNLTLKLSAVLTAGSCFWNIAGGTTALVGA